MPPRSVRNVLLASVVAAGLGACSSPENNPGVFGTTGGEAAGRISRGSMTSTGEGLATGASSGAMISATVHVIGKYKASERQRAVVVRRATAVVAKKRAAAPTTAGHTARHTPRYIAVDTVRDERTSPQAKKAVMIWDTQAQEVVGNDVYDVQTPPPVGSTARFETYSAEYVGAGS